MRAASLSHSIPKFPRRSVSLLTLAALLGASIGMGTVLQGCTPSEQFGTLTVQGDLTPGTTLTLETMANQYVFEPVASQIVPSAASVTYTRLIPGEYRITTPDATGSRVQLIEPFGVGTEGVTVVTYHAPVVPNP